MATDSPSCSWKSEPLSPVDGIAVLRVQPECWPGFGADELRWLAVSQTLAGAWDADDPETWRHRLLAICTDLDTAVGINALGTPLINPAALAYALRRGLADSFIAEGELAKSEIDWRLAELRWATVIGEDMAGGFGLAWKYAALTASGLYCPEHRTHLRHHREELLTLETTVQRCASSPEGWCVHLKDIAVTPDTQPTLDAIADSEAELKAQR